MPTNLMLLLVILVASELNTWMLAGAMLFGLVDAGLLSCAAVYVWVRLGLAG